MLPLKLQQLQQKLFELRKQDELELQHGDTGFASAPSNIALLKYWGKEEGCTQIPVNSSVSLTLGGFRSTTQVSVLGRFFPLDDQPAQRPFEHTLTLKNSKKEVLHNLVPPKMQNFLNALLLPYAPEIALNIESTNSFPTGCGIASSASGYAALVSAMADLLQLNKHFTQTELNYWLCEWARVGSGSATRSALCEDDALFVAWERQGENKELSTTTKKINHHKNWQDICHMVLVLDEEEKEISSSQGHGLANTSPLQAIRVANAHRLYPHLIRAIEEFNFSEVARITEEDAFAMHAVMQSAEQPARYLNGTVAKIIASFIEYRTKNNIDAFWTLDAGPNLHFIAKKDSEASLEIFLGDMQKSLEKIPSVLRNDFEHGGVRIGINHVV